MDIDLKIPKIKYILLYALTGSLLTTIVPIMVAFDHIKGGRFLLQLLDVSALFIIVTVIFYLSFWLNIKGRKKSKINLFFINLLVLLVVSIVSIAIHFPIWVNTIHIPIVFYFRDEIVRNITIFIVSYLASIFYIKNFENQEITTAFNELKNENLTNQVQGLMQQINPHFFFNTLNTLSGLVQESPEKSEIFIDKLSHVFRYVLKLQENNTVLLSEELKFAEDYFYLLKMRFDDKLFLNLNVNHPENKKIVPLCTQLLIENVIKHNRMNRQFPVEINIDIEQGYLRVCNTSFPQKSNNSNGFGLQNLNKRCELLCQKPIIINQNEHLFCVKIPIIN